jgi:hypothetical protein
MVYGCFCTTKATDSVGANRTFAILMYRLAGGWKVPPGHQQKGVIMGPMVAKRPWRNTMKENGAVDSTESGQASAMRIPSP